MFSRPLTDEVITEHLSGKKTIGVYAMPLRGGSAFIQAFLDANGVALDVIDERQVGVPLAVSFRGTLNQTQERAVQALCGHDTGILSAATAFGKTVVGGSGRSTSTRFEVDWIETICGCSRSTEGLSRRLCGLRREGLFGARGTREPVGGLRRGTA